MLKSREINTFLNNFFKEYSIIRSSSAHPSGICAIDYKIVYLKQLNNLSCEILMDYGGIPILDHIQEIIQTIKNDNIKSNLDKDNINIFANSKEKII